MFRSTRSAMAWAAPLLALSLLSQGPVAAQEVVQTSVSTSGSQSTLMLELADGSVTEVSLNRGSVYIDGAEVGSYVTGGGLESAWRDFLRSGAVELASAWDAFSGLSLEGTDAGSLEAIRARLEPLVTGATSTTAADLAAAPEAPAVPEVSAQAEPAEVPAVVGVQELVDGGLVVQVPEVENLARTLGRVGLSPGLSRALNGGLGAPLRIVVEADHYSLPAGATLNETLVLVETDAVIAGTVTGNLVVAESDVVLERTAVINGNIISIESDIQNLGATVSGTIRELENFAPIVIAPRRNIRITSGSGTAIGYVARGVGSLVQTAAIYLLMCFLGFLVVYFFRNNLEVVSDTVSYSFGRAFLTGLFAEMLTLPILVVLLVLVLTWIAIPFYVLGVVLAAVLGYLAVAHAAGENMTSRRYPSWARRLRRANSYYYIVNGLAPLLGIFAIAAVAEMAHFIFGWAQGLLIAAAVILSWVATTAGFGAVLLSRAGTQRRFARPAEVPTLSSDPFGGVLRRRRGASAARLSDLEPPASPERP